MLDVINSRTTTTRVTRTVDRQGTSILIESTQKKESYQLFNRSF